MKRLKISINKNIDDNKNNYVQLLGKLEVLNPITTIKRGYTITRSNNKPIKSIKSVKENDLIESELSDGLIISKVIDTKEVTDAN